MLSYLFCLTFGRRAYTNIRTGRVVPHVSGATFPRFLPPRHHHAHLHTLAHRHNRKLEEDNNPLLRGPWLKAARAEFTVDDFDAFCRDPSPHIPSSFHPTLKLAYETIFVPAIAAQRQGLLDTVDPRRVLIANLAQRPIVIQTIDDVLNLAATINFLDKSPTPVQCAQFMAAHAKVVGAIHRHVQPGPASSRPGFFNNHAGYPFAVNPTRDVPSVTMISTTSIPSPSPVRAIQTRPDPTFRILIQRYTKGIVADEVARRLGEVALGLGRRTITFENHAFNLRDAIRNNLKKPTMMPVLGTLKADSDSGRIVHHCVGRALQSCASNHERMLDVLYGNGNGTCVSGLQDASSLEV